MKASLAPFAIRSAGIYKRNSTPMSDENLIKLQTIIGHQQADISALSDELYLQQKEIVALKHQMNQLHEKLTSLVNQDEGIDDIANQKPPHY